jgi:hypothetical protein
MTDRITILLKHVVVKGGRYLQWEGCRRKSTLPENRGAPYYCVAGVGPNATVRDKHLQEFKLFDGGVFAICEYSGMNLEGGDGKRRVHWGDCTSTCSYPENVDAVR